MAEAACGRCQYYVAEACHRRPPIPVVLPTTPTQTAVVQTVFPRCAPEDWCGEFRDAAEGV